MERDVHPDLRALAFLLGRWEGRGEGVWPPGPPFEYAEETTFEHAGEAFLAYAQRSWGNDGSVLHLERGFFRPSGPYGVEVVLAHPLGAVEIAEGSARNGVVDVESTHLLSSRTGTALTQLRRRIEVEDDVLRYELWMATPSVQLTTHLRAELKRR